MPQKEPKEGNFQYHRVGMLALESGNMMSLQLDLEFGNGRHACSFAITDYACDIGFQYIVYPSPGEIVIESDSERLLTMKTKSLIRQVCLVLEVCRFGDLYFPRLVLKGHDKQWDGMRTKIPHANPLCAYVGHPPKPYPRCQVNWRISEADALPDLDEMPIVFPTEYVL